MRAVHARVVFTGHTLLHNAVVEFDGDVVLSVRPARSGDPDALNGMLIPGLVNAHTHLEFSYTAGLVPGGTGFRGWVAGLFGVSRPDAEQGRQLAIAQAEELFRSGTRAVCDISNGGDSAGLIRDAGLVGVVQHELLGMNPAGLDKGMEAAHRDDQRITGPHGSVTTRPCPHSPYSTPAALIQAASRSSRHPASIHLAEDAAERELLTAGTGAFAELLDGIYEPWRSSWNVPGCGPVDYLDRLGVLGPDLMLVHGTDLTPAELRKTADAKAPLCLCPRSNQHITGRLPNVPAAVEAGVPLAIGTDSLGSCADLDVLGDVALLCQTWPELSAEIWLRAATAGGAQALRLEGVGAFEPGFRPGALLLEGVEDPAQLRDVPRRRWVCVPGGVS